MVLFNTGPALCYYTIMELDMNYFYKHEKNGENILSLFNITSFESSWFNLNTHSESIKDENTLRFLFFGHTTNFKILNYDDRPEIKAIKSKISKLSSSKEKEAIWIKSDDFWFLPLENNSEQKLFDESDEQLLENLNNRATQDYETQEQMIHSSFSEIDLNNEENIKFEAPQ